MGMRTVFTMNVGPWTIYYLGYPQNPTHRLDPNAFGVETFANLAHTLGLLELYHMHGTESDPNFPGYSTGNTPPNLGFFHFGFTVPNVPQTLERLRKEGVEVVKDLGISTRRSIPISEWEDEKGYAKGPHIHDNYKRIFEQIAFVKDPVSSTS
jgi:lactoylglutathione lyase